MSDLDDQLTLALDTTTPAGSVAITRGHDTLALVVGEASRTHGERLPGDIAAVLERAGLALADISRLAVASGPGSFTGLRVGIAAIQGLALATSRPVVPIATLDALAACGVDAGAEPDETIAVWMDAQRGQVFAAQYQGRRQTGPPVSLPPAAVAARWTAGPVLPTPRRFVGDGAVRYRTLIAEHWPTAAIVAPPPLAPVIGRLAAEPGASPVAPHAIVPIYVRPPDAELARDRARMPAGRTET